MTNEQYFSYIRITNKFNNKNDTEMKEGWANWCNGFWLPLERYGECDRNEILVFCGLNYIIFLNIQKRFFLWRGRGSLQTRYPLWLSNYNLTIPSRVHPYQQHRVPLSSYADLSPGNIYHYPVERRIMVNYNSF